MREVTGLRDRHSKQQDSTLYLKEYRSSILPMDTPSPITPPPTPWIGKTTPDSNASSATQTWATATDLNALLTIHYPSRISGSYRLIYNHCYTGLIFLFCTIGTGCLLAPVSILGIVLYFKFFVYHQPITSGTFHYVFSDVARLGKAMVHDLFPYLIPLLLIYPAFICFVAASLKIFPGIEKINAATVWQFGSSGGAYRSYSRKVLLPLIRHCTAFKWQDIRHIHYKDGDVRFIVRNILISYFIGYFFFLPRESFADTEAAQRFHEAVTALWKAGGDPAGLPVAMLTEFAPMPSRSP